MTSQENEKVEGSENVQASDIDVNVQALVRSELQHCISEFNRAQEKSERALETKREIKELNRSLHVSETKYSLARLLVVCGTIGIITIVLGTTLITNWSSMNAESTSFWNSPLALVISTAIITALLGGIGYKTVGSYFVIQFAKHVDKHGATTVTAELQAGKVVKEGDQKEDGSQGDKS